MNQKKNIALIKKFCMQSNLSTYDPYDIWKTKSGFKIKSLYNYNKYIGSIPGTTFTLFDIFLNNNIRLFYKKQEFPIVRAFAALIFLNLHSKYPNNRYILASQKHIEWLIKNNCKGAYKGIGWGLSFNYAVSRNLSYKINTPYSTMTPYVLEAIIRYQNETGNNVYQEIIKGIYNFFAHDLVIMEENDKYMAVSYTPKKDRIVINASSYTMYSFALLLKHIDKDKIQNVKVKIKKLYNFIKTNQKKDGSWLYSPYTHSFIDCFNSCIVLKNLIKTNRIFNLEKCDQVINKGYAYITDSFLEDKSKLFKRFTKKNKPGLIKYDLYDNAEVLNLAILLNDGFTTHFLLKSIEENFIRDNNIYSQIDIFNINRNKNFLRWAIMPYLYAISQLL